MTQFENDDANEFFREEAKRYPGATSNPDLSARINEAQKLAQLAVNLFEHTLAVVRENHKLSQESLDISRESLRLVKQHLEKGNDL